MGWEWGRVSPSVADYRESGERRELPQRGSVRSPGEKNEFDAI